MASACFAVIFGARIICPKAIQIMDPAIGMMKCTDGERIFIPIDPTRCYDVGRSMRFHGTKLWPVTACTLDLRQEKGLAHRWTEMHFIF
jgi:hypothetical protein